MGRPFDFILAGFHIPAALSAIGLVAGLLGGGLAALKSRIGLPLVGLMVWMAGVTPFSFWRGGSVDYTARFAFTTLAFLLPLAAGPRSVRDIGRLMLLAAAAPTMLLLLTGSGASASAAASPGEQAGRLALGGGTFANSGDLALLAAFAVPFWLFTVVQFSWPVVRVPVGLLGAAYLVRAALLSGTRAVLLGGAGMLAVYFFALRGVRRLILPVAAGIGVFVVAWTVPGQILSRLASLVDAVYASRAEEMSEAELSAAQRRELLRDSLRFTLRHPLTGVGPGQFTNVRWEEGVVEGQTKGWLITHNTYTQVSSENGIPALLLYVAFLFGIYRTLRNVKALNVPDSHPGWRTVRSMRNCLMAALVLYAICAFFLSTLGYMHVVLVAGLALSLERVTRTAIARAASTADAAADSTSPESRTVASRSKLPAARRG
jgi:O-antigen ligase